MALAADPTARIIEAHLSPLAATHYLREPEGDRHEAQAIRCPHLEKQTIGPFAPKPRRDPRGVPRLNQRIRLRFDDEADDRCAQLAAIRLRLGERAMSVESRCGAVALGRACLFPPLSSGGALVAQP